MKKIVSIILSLILIAGLNSTAFAVEPTAEQLAQLAEYRIFTGDQNGNLRLDDNINRAEAAKMICTILGMDAMTNISSSFPDVAPGHWAEGWIEMAKGLGIVNGDDNGNFRPFDPVTNEEYIKMLVVAMGFEPMAEARGGFPAGYIAIANTYAITEGMQFPVNQAAKRGDVAVMTYRSLDMPIMAQTGFGSQVEYQIMDGKNGTAKMTLRLYVDPDYTYTDEKEKSDSASPEFAQSIYSYEDTEIKNLTHKNGEYTFTDKKKSDSPLYVADSNTYVHLNKRTVPLSAAKDGYYARVLCTEKEDGIVRVLGIEIYEYNPNITE